MNEETSQGTQGVQGFQGVQGVQGEKGATAPGIPGVQGEKGEQGVQGNQGNRGREGKVQRSAIFGYLLLTVGMVLGIYFVGQNSSDQLKEKINTVVTTACINELKPTSNSSKFNDLVDSLIITRTDAANEAEIRGDIELLRINQAAIQRYHENKIVPKTLDQCEKSLIP